MTGLCSEPALATELRLRRGRYFFCSLSKCAGTSSKCNISPLSPGIVTEYSSCTRMHFSTAVSASRFETVADSTQRFQIARMPWIPFNFLPQAPHKDINRTGRHEGAFFPHRVKQLVAGENTPPVPGQIFEEPELADRGE